MLRRESPKPDAPLLSSFPSVPELRRARVTKTRTKTGCPNAGHTTSMRREKWAIDHDRSQLPTSKSPIDRDRFHISCSETDIDRDQNHISSAKTRIDRDRRHFSPKKTPVDRVGSHFFGANNPRRRVVNLLSGNPLPLKPVQMSSTCSTP